MKRLAVALAAVALLSATSGGATFASSDGATVSAAVPEVVRDRTSCTGSVPTVMTNLTGSAANAVEALGSKYVDGDGVRAVVFDGNAAVLVVSAETFDEWSRALPDVPIAVSCVPTALVDAARKAVESADPGAHGFASVGYDGLRDAVSVITTLPVADVTSAIDGTIDLEGAAAVTDGALRIESASPGDFGPASRTNDGSPHWGGVWITTPSTGHCSTGFYLSSSTFGTVMVTAAHCFGGNGQTVHDESGANVIGTSEGWSANDPDLALIDGSSYYRRSYSSNDQTSNKLITSKASPQVGVSYCQMGSTSLRRCSAYSQLDVTANYGGRTVRHLAYTQGPAGPGGSLGSAGDSGGGVFRELTDGTLSARGIVVAAGCDSSTCARWDEPVNIVESHFSGTVVTSG